MFFYKCFLYKCRGKRKRKVIIEIDVSKCLTICPVSEEAIEKAEKFELKKRIAAVSSESADDIWMLLYNDEDDQKHLVFIESDARIQSIFRTVAPHIISKRT